MDDVIKDVEKFSALSEPDIEGVTTAIENVVQGYLAEGKIVRLGKLGVFYPTLSSSPADTVSLVSSNSIKKIGVRYRPGARILSSMRDAGFQKVSDK